MKRFFLLFFLCCLFGIAKSQSIFYIEYRYTTIDDTTLYKVFLVNNEDGTGFYRVKFYDEESHSNMIVDLNMEQLYYTDKNGYTDTTKIYFRGSDPQIVAGDKDYKYYPERFWFKLDKSTDLYEPWAVTSPDEKGTAQGKL